MKKIDDYILNWSILKTAPAYSNISKRCVLCLQEKFEIIKHPNQNCLLNKKSELISKCRHENKFLLKNYKNKWNYNNNNIPHFYNNKLKN
mgnify:CR=1 FL=1